MTKPEKPVLVRRRKVILDPQDEDGGGSWKIAYADFTTAMMALFIVLWLTSITSEEQRDKLAEFFNPISVSRSHSGSDAVLNGRSIDSEGGLDTIPQETTKMRAQDAENHPQDKGQHRLPGDAPSPWEVADQLNQSLKAEASVQDLLDQVQITTKGGRLSVTILDSPSVSMFRVGSAQLEPDAEALIRTIGMTLASTPGQIRIEGHTDGRTFPAKARYSNWELSGDRANAARRTLEEAGIPAHRIDQIEGHADRALLKPEDPLHAMNRRVVIQLLGTNPTAKQSLLPQ